ncbi:efflux RND transporter periplasmic adaptor subunit [Lutibacter maritimus]|jgi:Cu(I)/Ag(I) efflux system membrane fusion protein|uniref:Membrane fusion protein, Cu(I)/Ag(I) efflux system n=1 Tax=Lutibacter maritimus TaxID=593133 RepID=A0A1I6Q0D8_9FLAO|nr:efflux RND transporter periplasmic adaptor subunit [Lutibacter maritimus]SFS45916.1 membrane fusion protein, Cu(I)/Ag(I) efflux system [Lutibacter maritimus]
MTTKIKNILKIAGILFIGLLLGWMLFGGSDTPKELHDHTAEQEAGASWTCSMHPQIRQSEPGQCPLCGMDLIPVASDDAGADPNALQMSENAMKLANIQTMFVGTSAANKELRLNGKVQVDERKLYTQSTHIPGRIENLRINFTGENVSKGQTLATVYSPDLVTAQEELLQAYAIKNSQPELFAAAKQKLMNWKIGESTINRIISSGKLIQQFSITSDVSGIVIAKKVDLGDYVGRGMPIYEIADLSSLWVLFDVYESDMAWVKVGDKVSYTIQSIPGETFEGTISFVDPIINAKTRVATARVEIKNVGNKLKPEMFASGIIKNNLGKKGSQEIIIPKSAIMWTGERSVIYIKNNAGNKVNFTLREVTLGPSLGEAFVIKSGLESGEEIVVNGTFTVDAASQLAGKPSMMNLEGGKAVTGHAGHGKKQASESAMENKEEDHTNHTQSQTGNSTDTKNADHTKMESRIAVSKDFQSQLNKVFVEYISLKNAFTNDNSKTAQENAVEVVNVLAKVDMKLLSNNEAHKHWMTISKEIAASATSITKTSDINVQRNHFIHLSAHLSKAIKLFGINKTVYEQFCPMANNDNGAFWLSLDEEIRNPYYGKAMLKCGSTEAIIK